MINIEIKDDKLILTRPVLNPDEIRQAEKRFEWLLSFLICRFKFVHHVLGIMHKRPIAGMGTMGVSVTPQGKFELVYDPAFVHTMSDSELTYVFYHEILHLVLHHCTTRKFDNHDLGNIADDLAVNELIPISDACQIPKDKNGKITGMHVSEFKKEKIYSDIEPKQTAEWYYDYLMKKAPPKDGGSGGKGKGKASFDDHDGWKENEVADERVRAKVREIDINDLWGDISQAEREMILAAQVKRINWRNKIRVWFGNLAWKFRQSTRKKPNRRTGYMHPGSKKLFMDRWLVAADTSGSVDAKLLSQWLGVVNQLADEMPIDFMQFDCEKTEDPKPYDHRQLKLEFKGRGGTNFQPVIDIVEKQRYKGVMILTDGEAAAPTRPRSSKVLWVLPEGHNPPVDWGDRIHLQKHV